MNAVSALLLSLLVHLGGVELDTTRDASLQWFRNSELTGQWELEASRAGAYRFVSDEGLVIVERLREGNMTYALQQLETTESTSDVPTGPIPRTLRSLGTVSLQPHAQNLRSTRSSMGQLTVDAARMPVAWTAITPDTRSGDELVDPAAVHEDPAPTGNVTVSVTPGQWSVSHADSGQVMVLQVR